VDHCALSQHLRDVPSVEIAAAWPSCSGVLGRIDERSRTMG
jgi:hypothetical protein